MKHLISRKNRIHNFSLKLQKRNNYFLMTCMVLTKNTLGKNIFKNSKTRNSDEK